MALLDVLQDANADAKEKKKGDKKYVTFSLKEWGEMEAMYKGPINPLEAKKVLYGIFTGKYNVSVNKGPKPA